MIVFGPKWRETSWLTLDIPSSSIWSMVCPSFLPTVCFVYTCVHQCVCPWLVLFPTLLVELLEDMKCFVRSCAYVVIQQGPSTRRPILLYLSSLHLYVCMHVRHSRAQRSTSAEPDGKHIIHREWSSWR